MLEDYLSSTSPVDAVALEIKIEGYLLCRLNGVKKNIDNTDLHDYYYL